MTCQTQERERRFRCQRAPRSPRIFSLYAALILSLAAASGVKAAEITVREVGSATLNQPETVTKVPGEVVTLEIVVDTGGMPLSGYSYGISITPGAVSGITHNQPPLPPLMNLGMPTVDEANATVTGIAQVGFFGSAPAGVYVLDRIEFSVDTIPPLGISVAAGFHSSGESLILSGETCPGTLVDCTVTFNSMNIVAGGPSVPMISPFGIIFLVVTLLLAGFRALASPSLVIRNATGRYSLPGLFSVIVVSLAVPAFASGGDASPGVMSLDASSPRLAEEWGIEVVAVRLTGVNRFLDFRYRVIDADRAKPLFGPKVKPTLIDSTSGYTLKVPVPPKLGPMKSTRGEAYAGRQYFVFFANPGGSVKAGNEVAVDFGELTISGLKVQ
jgi:hypothetical protein